MLDTLLCYTYILVVFFFFKQKTAYEMRISDWSSDVCSSDLRSTLFYQVLGYDLALDFGGIAENSARQTIQMPTDYCPTVFWHWSLIGNCECWTIECQIDRKSVV